MLIPLVFVETSSAICVASSEKLHLLKVVWGFGHWLACHSPFSFLFGVLGLDISWELGKLDHEFFQEGLEGSNLLRGWFGHFKNLKIICKF
jgi:hypothetical protein